LQGGVGNLLILIGIIVLLAGVLAKAGVLGWFGNLPGDISFRRGGFRFYLPLTSMILVSAILSLLVGLIRRFF